MTDIVPASGGGLAPVHNPLNRPEGLEDFGTQDQIMPIIRIDHHEAAFVDSLSQMQYPELNVVILGLIKGRTLWPAQVQPDGSGEQPLCRSYDFNTGIPVLVDKDGDAEPNRFPWEAAGFSPTDQPLPCSTCKLKDWGTHPTRDAPWCSEVHTFGIMLPTDDEGGMQPSLIQIQRSSLKSSRKYCSAFAGRGEPMFTAWTKLTLEKRKMGNNPYCVINFEEIQRTDPQYHTQFSASYRGIREYITTPRTSDGDESDGDDMPATPEQAPVQSQPEPAAPVSEPVSEAPVAAPAPAPAPAAPTPAPAPPAPVAAAPAAPMAAPAPSNPMAAPAPAPAAPVEAPQQDSGTDVLPF